jgi:hypothetical protein
LKTSIEAIKAIESDYKAELRGYDEKLAEFKSLDEKCKETMSKNDQCIQLAEKRTRRLL